MKKVLFLTALATTIMSLVVTCFAIEVTRIQSYGDLVSSGKELNVAVSKDKDVATIDLDANTLKDITDYIEKVQLDKQTPIKGVSKDVLEKLQEAGVIASLAELVSGDNKVIGTITIPVETATIKRSGEKVDTIDFDKVISAIKSGDVSIQLPHEFHEIAGKVDLKSGDNTKVIAELIDILGEKLEKASGDKEAAKKSGEDIKEVVESVIEKINWSEASSWALDELSKANEKGLIPKIFDKANLKSNVTRKEFAHIAVKLYEAITGLTERAAVVPKNPFTDTDDMEVLCAYELGITQGTTETTFSPDKEITREQMATMITRALEKAGVDVSIDLSKVKEFTDDSEMHNWSRSAIYFMADKEIIKGIDSKQYRYGVKNNASREQALVISNRSSDTFKK